MLKKFGRLRRPNLKGVPLEIGRCAHSPRTKRRKKKKGKTKEDKPKLNTIRLIEIRTQEKDKIQIPIPSYGYGATRRSRFAFGRITAHQARTNTAKHIKPKTTEADHE